MVSSICWCVIQGLLVLSLPDLVMYFYRPFPKWICFFQLILRHALVLRLLLLIDAAVIARFILIFWIKNPLNFQNDFWCHFVNIWAVIFRFSFTIYLSFSGSLSSHFWWFKKTALLCLNHINYSFTIQYNHKFKNRMII